MQAAFHGHVDTFAELLKFKADVNATDSQGKKPINLAKTDACRTQLNQVRSVYPYKYPTFRVIRKERGGFAQSSKL
jgi:hypothetical protein